MNGDFRQHFAIESNPFSFQTADEFAIAGALGTASGIDPDNPKPAKFAFPCLAIAKGINAPAHQGNQGLPNQIMPAHDKTFCQLEQAFAAFGYCFSATSACHSITPIYLRNLASYQAPPGSHGLFRL